ncbi:unnamed protein product, partial [Ectocarpus sp. 4 AP-2014]
KRFSTLLSQQSFSSRPTAPTHPSPGTKTTHTIVYRINHDKKMPSTATLHYFDDPGCAEATRVVLAYAGKDFEDNIMGFHQDGASKWAGIGLPVLEVRQTTL